MSERFSIKEPIPEIEEAKDKLSEAANAHLAGDYDRATELFRETNESADARKIWHWLNPDWGRSKRTSIATSATSSPKGTRTGCPQNSGIGRTPEAEFLTV